MSYQATTTQYYSSRRRSSASWNRNQNTVPFVSNIKMGPISTLVIIVLLLSFLGVIYLNQATKVTSYDYAVQDIDSKIAELEMKNSDLEVENARLTALNQVQESNVAKAMVVPESTEYAR